MPGEKSKLPVDGEQYDHYAGKCNGVGNHFRNNVRV